MPETIVTELNNLKDLAVDEDGDSSKKLWKLLEVVPPERQDELAELLVDFCQKHQLLLLFMSHTIHHEVQLTLQETTLFREDCFAVKAVNRILFNDIGKRYLIRLVAPMVRDILAVPYTIEINDSSDPMFERNVSTLLDILDSFMKLFAASPQFCPLIFREIFSHIQGAVDKKFGANNDSPLVLDFIFFKFICPALIHPKKYDIIPEIEIPRHALRSLINVSKVLNNLAHNVNEKFTGHSRLQTFVAEKNVLLIAQLRKLLDPKEIQMARTIIHSSIGEISYTVEEKREARERLHQFLEPVLYPPVSKFLKGSDIESSGRNKVEELLAISSITEWKNKSKGNGDVTLSHSTDTATGYPRRRYSITVKVSMLRLFDYLKILDNRRAIWSDEALEDCTMLYESHGYREYRTELKMPFPLNNREYLMSEWYEIIDEQQAVIVFDNLMSIRKQDYPRSKKTVRGKVYTSGFILESYSLNSTELTWIVHMNPMGYVPGWLSKKSITDQVESLSKFKVLLESLSSLKDSNALSPRLRKASIESDSRLNKSFASLPSSDELNFAVCCNYNNTTFTFEMNNSNFDSLRLKIEELYPGKCVSMKYKDSDDEMISINSNEGLKSALRQCQNYLKLFLADVDIVSAEETRLLNDVVDSVLIIDKLGEILYCNPATEKLFGYTKKHLLGKNIKMLMTKKDSRQHSDYLSRYVDSGIAQIIGKGRVVDCKDSNGVEFKARLTVNETKQANRHFFTGTLHKLDVNDDAYQAVDISTFIILDGFLDPMVVIDTMGIIQFANKAAGELLGADPKAVFGQNVKVLMPEPYQSEHDIYLANYRRSGISKIMNDPKGRDLPVRKADGTTVLRNATLATSEIGGKRYFTAVITPPRESEAIPLLEQERRVLNDMLVPSIVIDHKGVIQVFNPAAANAFGYQLSEVIGQNISILMGEDVRAAHDGYLSRYHETGESKIIGVGRKVNVKSKDGNFVPCTLYINRKSDGNQTFFTGMLQLRNL